jgi:hypothetical protein
MYMNFEIAKYKTPKITSAATSPISEYWRATSN